MFLVQPAAAIFYVLSFGVSLYVSSIVTISSNSILDLPVNSPQKINYMISSICFVPIQQFILLIH